MDLVCVWFIIVLEGKRVEFSFEKFDISLIGCFDFVQIFDGEINKSCILEEYCGDFVICEVQLIGWYMLVRFNFDFEFDVLCIGFKVFFKVISSKL